MAKSTNTQSKRYEEVESCDKGLPKQAGVRLSESEYMELAAAARAEGRTLSNYIRFLLFPPKGK